MKLVCIIVIIAASATAASPPIRTSAETDVPIEAAVAVSSAEASAVAPSDSETEIVENTVVVSDEGRDVQHEEDFKRRIHYHPNWQSLDSRPIPKVFF